MLLDAQGPLEGEVSHSAILREIHALREDIKPIRDDMSTLKDIIRAWEAASWFGRAIKWMGGFVVAVTAIYAYIKGGTPG